MIRNSANERHPDPTCSEMSKNYEEPVLATASPKTAYVLIEHPGSWGEAGLTDSGLGRRVALRLTGRAATLDVTLLLIRRPGGPYVPEQLSCFLIHTGRSGPWIGHYRFETPQELLELDLAALAKGQRPDGIEPWPRPLYAVCTHAKRDLCCAVKGRPLAKALAAVRPAETWEVSHIGGHRFAPTIVAFPHGLCFGRVSPTAAADLVQRYERGEIVLRNGKDQHEGASRPPGLKLIFRGRLGDSLPVQAADAFVRWERNLAGIDDLTPIGWDAEADGITAVWLRSRRDGRVVNVRVQHKPTGLRRLLSCDGKVADPWGFERI